MPATSELLKMIEFMGSSDHIPNLMTAQDCNNIPLKCWQVVNLSSIWIPSHLLCSRNKSSSFERKKSIFHTLEKKDSAKCIESFSVYVDQEQENEQEIFQSDSEEDLLMFESHKLAEKKNISGNLNTLFEVENIFPDLEKLPNKEEDIADKDKNNLNCTQTVFQEPENSLEVKDEIQISCNNTFKNQLHSKASSENMNIKFNEIYESNDVTSHNSLNEILDISPHVNIKDDIYKFPFDTQNKYSKNVTNDKESKISNKKERKNKKKAPKYLSLDEFLDDGTNSCTSDESCFNEFYQNIMRKEKGDIQVKDTNEFPDLVSKKPIFVKSNCLQKPDREEYQEISFKSFAEVLNELPESSENLNESDDHKIEHNEMTIGKLTIENIPPGVSEEDIRSLLFGYGEIKTFYLQATEESIKAYVEMDLICDIDWIIECLNGSEPFGAFSETLKCYKG